MRNVIVIAGPTASGKTGLSLALAEKLGGEIVSADSMQIYRGMDIGTAKATPAEQARAVHHMIDVVEPEEDYSVARYVEDAARCCDDILSRGKVPIITGGTGLYIDSLLSGRDFARRDEDSELRERLLREYDTAGGEEMHRRLAEIDPERAQKLPTGDRRRICRALEIYMLTGMTATEHDERTKRLPPRYEAVKLYLTCSDRSDLYRRIDGRVDAMIADGLFDEVAGLLARGVPESCTAMQAIGYKETAMALRGEISPESAAELIKMGSRRYAKRQLTWFRRDSEAHWLERTAFTEEKDLLRLSTEYIARRDIS